MTGIQSISKRLTKAAKSFAADESGGEIVEWVLLVGLIVVVCFAAMAMFGNTLGLRWNALVDTL